MLIPRRSPAPGLPGWLLVLLAPAIWAAAGSPGAHGVYFDVPAGWTFREGPATSSWTLSRGSAGIRVTLAARTRAPSANDADRLRRRVHARLEARRKPVSTSRVRAGTVAGRPMLGFESAYRPADGEPRVVACRLLAVPGSSGRVWCQIEASCPRESGAAVQKDLHDLLASLRPGPGFPVPGRRPAISGTEASRSTTSTPVIGPATGPTVLEPGPVPAPGGSPAAGTAPALVRTESLAADPSLSYELALPAGYDPGKRYPVLILLHSGGLGSHYMDRIGPAAREARWIVACSNDFTNDLDGDAFVTLVDKILADLTSRFAIDPARVFLGGHSGGGMASYVTAYFRPGVFAGIVANCGLIHHELAGPDAIRRMKLRFAVLFAGDRDRTVPPDQLRDNERRLAAAGVQTRLLPFKGSHAIAPPGAYAEAFRWLEERMGPATAGEPAGASPGAP